MVSKKTLISATVVGAFLVGGGAAATISDRAFRTVDPIDATGVEVVASSDDSGVESSSTPITVEPDVTNSQSAPVSVPSRSTSGVVPGLTEQTGVLKIIGDDFYFENREVDFGPDRWMNATTATGDLDGDGRVESWWDEVNGVVGRSVTVLGDVDDDDIDVFQINGLTVRPFDRPAPWSDDWKDDDKLPASTTISVDQAIQIALQQVPGSVLAVELDADDGVVYWDIEVRSTSGPLYDLEIDATTGRVIDVDRD